MTHFFHTGRRLSAAVVFCLLTLGTVTLHAADSTPAPLCCEEQSQYEAQNEEFSDGLKVEKFIKPPRLRACCAFGHDLRTSISGSAVPVKLDNIVYPDRLGQHSYQRKDLDSEMTGLIYTCRGGVIDLAHIRDYADWTAYLFERIRLVLGSSVIIPLPFEAAEREVVLRPLNVSLSPAERDELALLLAQRISFQLSVWHEIATWYDYRSVPMFSERLSSFSPEDLFSNAVGAELGARALRSGREYNEAMDSALAEMVHQLAPLPNSYTKKTLDAVDGIWWDRTKMLPDMAMVTRRNMDVSDNIKPWIITGKYSPYCAGRDDQPAEMAVPTEGPGGIKLKEQYELRFRVRHEAIPNFIPPDNGKEWIGEDDYPWIIENIRRDVKAMFGPYGDKSGMDTYELGVARQYSSEFDPEMPCGATDKDCKFTRHEEMNGIRIGKIRVAGGNFAGMFFGVTLAEGTTMGGLFNVLSLNSAVAFTDGAISMHVKGAESPVLFFCAMEAEDGSGRKEIDYPFVNPFNVKCVPGSYWGLRLELLELMYLGGDGLDSYGFRPVEAGIVFTPLGNGFTPEFLKRRLLFSLGLTPEIIDTAGTSAAKSLAGYFTVTSEEFFLNDRVNYKLFGSIRDDLTEVRRFNVEGGARLQYNYLWNRRDMRGGDPLHSIISFGVEASVNYWFDSMPSMPSLIKYAQIMPNRDFVPNDWHVSLQGILYVETTIPKLGMF